MISRTEDNRTTEFSSERLLRTLTRLGIPYIEAFIVLEIVENLIVQQNANNPKEDLTTWHLRQIVFKALHRLDPAKHSQSEIERWGNAYARRYGNPNNQVSIILEDGKIQFLNFKYLTEQFIPDLISEVMNVNYNQLRTELISKKDINRIAEEILSIVQYMHVYELHFETLHRLARDIALNPPHPWMVDQAFDENLIEYDLSRANEHVQNMFKSLNEDDIPTARHKCMECLDHSCSALLGYYGVFMGVKPFHNLIRTLKLVEVNPLLWSKLKIFQIEGDLSSLGTSLMDFKILLSKTQRLSGAYRKEKLINLMDNVAKIHKVIGEVLAQRKDVLNRFHQIERLDVIDKNSFDKLVITTFSSIPQLKLRNTIFERKSITIFRFEHEFHMGGIFNEIKPRVLVASIYTQSRKVSNSSIKTVMNFFNENRHLCNTIFIVSNYEFSKNSLNLAIDITKSNDQNFILVNQNDLKNLYHSQDRVKQLGEVVMGFYDKV